MPTYRTGAPTRRVATGESGAAAVEGALVCAFILGPLLVGLLTFGAYFWREQQTSLYPPRLSQSTVVGVCTTAQIVDRVKQTAAGALYSLNASTLNSLGIGSATALVDRLAVTVTSLGTLGADVDIRLDIPGAPSLFGLLPRNNRLLLDVTERLQYVSVSTNGSSCSSA